MQSKVNYTVVGIFVIVLSAFLVITIFWLSGIASKKHYQSYLVFMHEDVAGLSVESPVRFNGVNVGYVKSIRLDKDNSKLVRIKLDIEPGTKITTSTYATLTAQGVTGVVYVNLKAETESSPLLTSAPGQKSPIITSRPSLLTQLSTVLPEVAEQVKKLSGSISKVLDEENRQALKESLQNIAVSTRELPKTIAQLNKTLTSFDAFSTEMTKTTEKIDATMSSGEIAMHNFSNQVVPNAEQALTSLSRATTSMEQLTDQLQENPSMLLRGKEPAAPGPGEK
ncbi:MAG: hypothetical protein A3F13_01835 [Gammaproteobacteria bacterium RIFCSPHIGHO2_12_FULL_40_19]|nr:MAG: hypothetical protein A3F13_01835 [Gammaproteobacteria bacterium RIFCSPHIGHO2_12_FULL_40_19]